MGAFAYASIMMSIVIGLALTDVLSSAHRLFRAGRAVRWHWAAPAAAVLVVMTLIQVWWTLYQPSDRAITVGEFLPLFVVLVLLFLLAAAALPDSIPEEGLDLKAYYNGNGPYFWSLFAGVLAWLTFTDAVAALMVGDNLLGWIVDRGADLVVLGVFVSLIFVRRLWWHAVALLILSSGPIGWLSRSLG